MESPETLIARLGEAEAALHLLALGRREVQIGYDGKTVSFTAADEATLRVGRRPPPVGMVF